MKKLFSLVPLGLFALSAALTVCAEEADAAAPGFLQPGDKNLLYLAATSMAISIMIAILFLRKR